MWQELVKTALLGTERSQLSVEILHQLGMTATADPTQLLLESAAIYCQLRKAGYVLQNFIGNMPEKIVLTEEKFCSRRSIRHLSQILEGPYKKVLPEFIFLAARANKILPPEYLPALFQESLRQQALWHTAMPIIGVRGRWLLTQNTAWKRLAVSLDAAQLTPLSEETIYPVLENKFQIWGSDDVAFRARPSDFAELRTFWQSIPTRVYDNFIQKSLQILLFREEMIKELVIV